LAGEKIGRTGKSPCEQFLLKKKGNLAWKKTYFSRDVDILSYAFG